MWRVMMFWGWTDGVPPSGALLPGALMMMGYGR